MQIIVQKFGGTSVANIEKIKNVAHIIKTEFDNGNKIVAIVSAMSGITNSIISQCAKISTLSHESHMHEYDAAIASGEVVTAALLALQLQSMNLKAQSLQGWQIPINTNNIHGNARIVNINTSILYKMLEQHVIPIVTGFQGVCKQTVTTLGKGGSDTSAAIIAASLDTTRCDIYTDVDGIYSADPRIVPHAQKIDHINVDALYELCSSGAKILHPRAALAVKKYGFPMRILSSFTDSAGTFIQQVKSQNVQYLNSKYSSMEDSNVEAITSNKNLLLINVHYNKSNFATLIVEFDLNTTPIEQINNYYDKNQASVITPLVHKNKCQEFLQKLQNNCIIKSFKINVDIATVTLVGYGLQEDTKIISQIIKILTKNHIDLISFNISNIKISILIHDQDSEKAIKLLHNHFIE